jgi:hypothetical protein
VSLANAFSWGLQPLPPVTTLVILMLLSQPSFRAWLRALMRDLSGSLIRTRLANCSMAASNSYCDSLLSCIMTSLWSVGSHQLVVSTVAFQPPSYILIYLFGSDAMYDVDSLSLPNRKWMHDLMGCPTTVIIHGIKLSMKHLPILESIKFLWFHFDSAGLCIPTA